MTPLDDERGGVDDSKVGSSPAAARLALSVEERSQKCFCFRERDGIELGDEEQGGKLASGNSEEKKNMNSFLYLQLQQRVSVLVHALLFIQNDHKFKCLCV